MKKAELITIDWVGSKRSKAGKPYVSIKSGDSWYSCWQAELFSTLLDSRGKKLTMVIEQNGDFMNIIDIVSDELGVTNRVPPENTISSSGNGRPPTIQEQIDEIKRWVVELKNWRKS